MVVDAAVLEASLEKVGAQAAGSREGVFGPGSAIWQVDREAAIFLGAGRALLMQLAHPWVATAIAEHSTALDDPIGRFHRTFAVMFTLVFGSLDQALATARGLHRRHASVRGRMSESLGRFPIGSGYRANEASALMWVHATLVDTALLAYEIVRPPLGSEERERYFQESRTLANLFGIPTEMQPADESAFRHYFESVLASDALSISGAGRAIGTRVLSRAGRVPVPRWYRDLTACLLPESLRAGFELSFGADEQGRAARAIGALRRVDPVLPARARYVAPYYEALGRLSGARRPDLVTRGLNRLWIGRSSLAG